MTVGFVDDPDDPDASAGPEPEARARSIVVAAGAPETGWASNLLADPSVEVTVRGTTWSAVAELIEDGDPRRGRAVRDLILRYGTPSEGLGSGPIFVLRPTDDPT